MKFLSRRVAVTHTVRQNRSELHQCQSCGRLRGVCAQKSAEVTRHAHQSSHTGLTRNTVFTGLLRFDLASNADCPPLKVVIWAGGHFERWSRTLSDQFWRVQSRLPFSMAHVSRDHEFADSFPPQSIHEDVCTSVGGLDQTVWKVTIVVRIVQTHAAEVRTERHTVSHNATVFVSTLQKKNANSQAHVDNAKAEADLIWKHKRSIEFFCAAKQCQTTVHACKTYRAESTALWLSSVSTLTVNDVGNRCRAVICTALGRHEHIVARIARIAGHQVSTEQGRNVGILEGIRRRVQSRVTCHPFNFRVGGALRWHKQPMRSSARSQNVGVFLKPRKHHRFRLQVLLLHTWLRVVLQVQVGAQQGDTNSVRRLVVGRETSKRRT